MLLAGFVGTFVAGCSPAVTPPACAPGSTGCQSGSATPARVTNVEVTVVPISQQATDTPVGEPPPLQEPEPEPELKPFDTRALALALREAASQAKRTCSEPGGTARRFRLRAIVLPNGTVTDNVRIIDLNSATVTDCIVAIVRAIRISPFTGRSVSISKAFHVSVL